jgi:hypothetical protein
MLSMSSSDCEAMAAHLPKMMRPAESRVSDNMSSVPDFNSSATAENPRSGMMTHSTSVMILSNHPLTAAAFSAPPLMSVNITSSRCSTRSTPPNSGVRSPCRNSFTTIGERRSGKSVMAVATFMLSSCGIPASCGWAHEISFTGG